MSEKTIYQQFKEAELEEAKQREAVVSSIKELHAKGGVDFEGKKPNVDQSVGGVGKFSKGGRFLGWYKNDQIRGMPNQKMPLQQLLNGLYQGFKQSIISNYPKSLTGSVLAKKSAESRKENGLSSQILVVHKELISQGVPKHNRAKRIAQRLGCNVEYVRRVIREIKN